MFRWDKYWFKCFKKILKNFSRCKVKRKKKDLMESEMTKKGKRVKNVFVILLFTFQWDADDGWLQIYLKYWQKNPHKVEENIIHHATFIAVNYDSSTF